MDSQPSSSFELQRRKFKNKTNYDNPEIESDDFDSDKDPDYKTTEENFSSDDESSENKEDVYNDEKRHIGLLLGADKPQMIPLTVEGPPQKEDKESEIAYKLEDVPPWYLCLALGLQFTVLSWTLLWEKKRCRRLQVHYLTMIGGTVTYPYLVAPKLCIPDDHPARGYLISTTFVVSGLATFLQTTFGVRLPIVQGSTFALFVPILAILQLPQWECSLVTTTPNDTSINWDDVWMTRMREIQGAIIGASLFEVAIGFTGLMGILLTWITPLAIVPTVTLVGLSLFTEAANAAAGHWGIAFFTMLLLILFSQYFRNVNTPFPACSKEKGFYLSWFPFFKLFPVLLTIFLAWGLCAILTVTGDLGPGNPARTDLHLNILNDSRWFIFPYPGQWGLPTFSTAAVFGILAGILASAIESVGDYYACARLAGAPPPPNHAINRGIWAEGIGCILAGIWGTGGGLTSYSENIGAIGITKVASRRVIQYGAGIMLLFGMVGKVGALFVTIPGPIIGGVFCVMFAMITAVGLSTLHFVDLRSSRNLFVLGFSIFMGLSLPQWLQRHPYYIDTGNEVATQIISVLLGTSMFVGGAIGFILDNTIPGTDEERGILKWKKQEESEAVGTAYRTTTKAYDVPLLMPFLKKNSVFKYFPISPTFDNDIIKVKLLKVFHFNKRCMSKKRTHSHEDTVSNDETIHI